MIIFPNIESTLTNESPDIRSTLTNRYPSMKLTHTVLARARIDQPCEDRIGTGPPRARTEVMYED